MVDDYFYIFAEADEDQALLDENTLCKFVSTSNAYKCEDGTMTCTLREDGELK